MYPFYTSEIVSHERGISFVRDELVEILPPGRYQFFDPMRRRRVDVLSTREAWIKHEDLDILMRSGLLDGHAEALQLAGNQRALVWIDGCLDAVLKPGSYALWTEFHDIRVEVIDADTTRLRQADLDAVLACDSAAEVVVPVTVREGWVAAVYQSGKLHEILTPGRYAYWREMAPVEFRMVDLRETVADLVGQELMTADKVTLRLNAVLSYRVVDTRVAIDEVDDFAQTLYREAQLALRALVGGETLDGLLGNKLGLSDELLALLQPKAERLGVQIISLGIRDVILPGDMKDLLNKVTEAKKAAEAAVISRREETAAMRSQLNTAKLIENNPTLMRLRELETLERVAAGSTLNVVVGDTSLAHSVLKLV